ncbi:putative chromodomain-helicase-DNA-binding protein [Plasmopara halstedii]
MKEDVEKSLAPKEETIIEVELTVLQKQYYRAIYEKNTEFLSRGSKKGDTPSLMNVLMELRKCCNHPFLVRGVEEREVKRLTKQKDVSKEEIQRQIRESLVDTAGKLTLLDKLLPRLKDNGHRVLIFSQFKIMLDILQDYLALRRYNCERIDGNITGNERQSAIDRFSREDSTSFIMLLSTRAGGVGINLTAADTVIIYDSDWNPQNDLQAQARCHRIGQKKSVKIYRLLTAKTYELHMFHTASLKLGLDQAVLGGIKNDDPVAKLKGTAKSSKTNDRMSKEEIENLLKHGAYEIFKEQDSEAEAASKQFSEESIDQILSRSTTIVHDPTRGNGNETKSVMSSFSKATFVSSTNPDEEVDVDDPNFWTKVIGLNGVEEQKKTEPSPLQKRRCRRKVKSYLTDDDKTYMIDGSEDERACRKKLFRGMEVQKDEEFVISNEDDDDDDDMSNSSMTEDDHSVDNKRKRTQLLNIPIFHHVERIIELLGSFGYGRWDDMKRHCSTLQAYPNAELIQFAQKFVTGMVRVMTATTTFERIGLGLEPSRVYIVSSTPPPLLMGSASPIERYAYELNVSARRFPFLLAMMKDMQVENLLAVAVPPSLWLTDYQSRTARGFRTKLQQIDIMYRLSEFVQLNFSKAPALVHTIECLQSIGNEAVVQNMIESGTVPPLPVELPIKQKETVKPASEIETFKKTEVVSVEDTASKDEKAAVTTDRNPIASTLSSKSEKLDEAECKMISSAEVATHDNHTISQSDEVKSVEKNDETIDMSSEKHLAIEKYSKTPPDCVNIPGSGPTQTPTETSDDKNEKNVDTLSCENKFIPRNTGAENESDSSLRENAGSGPAKEPIVQGKSGPLAENERMQAMRILGSLPPVNSPELVAPWWISRVDDVMLLIHVYREGWVKGRGIPSQMVNISTLFGHRAKCYPTSKWPSMAILNRRLKLLLHLWTSTKSTSIAPSTTSIATALNLTTSKLQRQQQLLDLQQKLQHQLEHQRVPHAKMSANNVRHNQFAKLVFSFGIPDVSTCQDMRERNEKWRYFLQDSQLNIGHCSLEELLAEAHDLERVCRHRLRAAADRQIISMFSNEDSILGGKRGFWLLTTTQCRRLVHRIDLFRLLRTQILILPPAQLVEVVARVVRVQSVSTEYPAWWSSPRHDILLLQGVECYGLDEHLASVWKLPLFSSANTTNSNPGFSWVENYVTALALTCRNLLIKVLKNRAERLIDLSNDDTEISRSRPSRNQESETVRRIRDIGAMRKEDPHVVPSVRLRQIFESNTSQREKRREELSPVKLNPIKSLLMPEEETALMQLEDPCFSTHVRAIWAKQKKHDEIKDANAHSALSCKASSDALEDTVDRNGSSTQDMEMTSPSSKNKGNNDSGKVAKEVHVSMSKRPVRAAAVAAISKLNNSRISSSGKSQDLDVASDKVTVAKSEPKKSVQSWNVIVIDSSDDSD